MEVADIACIPKYLPTELAVPAAATAIAQNPVNRPMTNGSSADFSILSPPQIAVLVSKWWSAKGVNLTVNFMEPTPADLQRRILAHMNEWSKYANVKFVLVATDPQVRITRALEGYWSYLGTDILHIARSEATMCLQGFTNNTSESEFKRVVRHETGHTLGCPHEHMRTSIINRIDVQRAIRYFHDTQGWTPAMVMSQVLTPLAESSLMGSPDADETSIMAYTLPGIVTKDGRPIIGGNDIGPQDIEFIGKIYPIQNVPPQPPLPPIGAADFSFQGDFTKKIFYARLPAGWKLAKEQGAEMDSVQAMQVADELEALIPVATADHSADVQMAMGGFIGSITKLVAALRSGDWALAYSALLEILMMFAPKPDGDGSISFQRQAGLFGLDKGKFVALLMKLLPLLLSL